MRARRREDFIYGSPSELLGKEVKRKFCMVGDNFIPMHSAHWPQLFTLNYVTLFPDMKSSK